MRNTLTNCLPAEDTPIASKKPEKAVTAASSRGRKLNPHHVVRHVSSEQQRSLAAYRAMETLMESDALSSDELWLAISPLTGRELHEVSPKPCAIMHSLAF